MRIAFDASDLCTGRADGTTRYTRELLSRIPGLLNGHEVHAFAPCAVKMNSKSITWHASPFPKYWTQAKLPFELFKHKPDVLFMPIQQLPIIRPPRMKTIAAVHDLAFHEYGQYTSNKDWLLLHAFTAQAVREADHIIAVSQATKDDIAKVYGRTENVHVVHHGVDHTRFNSVAAENSSQVLIDKHPELKHPYILYVGQIQPRKNIAGLVSAFEKLEDKELHLVIAGGHGWFQKQTLAPIQKSSAMNRIHVLGAVDDSLLPALYQHAQAFVLPSFYEGFGIPVLEAMACGTPVITSTISSMPEIAGDAAVLVDPNNSDSIAQGITHAIANRENFSQKGIERAKKFTWEHTAEQTVEIIRKTL